MCAYIYEDTFVYSYLGFNHYLSITHTCNRSNNSSCLLGCVPIILTGLISIYLHIFIHAYMCIYMCNLCNYYLSLLHTCNRSKAIPAAFSVVSR